MKYILLILSISSVVSCTATMVSYPGNRSDSAYAPINESSRGGVVRYSIEGAKFLIKKKREDAYQKMWAACDGKYKIDKESQMSEGEIVDRPFGDNGIEIHSDVKYWYIHFSCVKN